MNPGPKRTFDFLRKTENEAAVDVLVAGLDDPGEAVRDNCLRTLIGRRSPAGHREVFSRLSTFDEHARAIINERPDRLIQAARAGVQATSQKACKNAFDAIQSFGLYDSLPVLLEVLRDRESPIFNLASVNILKLTERFYTQLCAPESEHPVDFDNVRRRVTSALEEGVGRFFEHQRPEVVESFLLIAKPQNVILRRILQSPDDKSREIVLEVMAKSTRGGVLRLLLGFIEDPQFPNAVKDILASRKDAKFVQNLLGRVGTGALRNVYETLKRFDSFAWAEPNHPLFEKLDDTEQANAVNLLMSTSMDRDKLLEILGFLVIEGKPGGQRAAAKRLAEFQQPAATAIVVRGLNIEDATVRATLLKQLRPRNVPGAMSLLIRMVGTKSEEVCEALREAMPEFTFRQFMANFDSMHESMLPMAGQVVRQIDGKCQQKLEEEMECLSPVRRRRAVTAAGAMGLAGQIEKTVIRLLSDEDHIVRIAAAKTLADCGTMPSWEALRDALLDRSVMVQEAAERSLTMLCQSLAQGIDEEEDADAEQTTKEEVTS